MNTIKEFTLMLKEKFPDSPFEIVDHPEILNNSARLNIKCLKCNHTFEYAAGSLLSARDFCPFCDKVRNNRQTYETLKEEFEKVEGYKVLDLPEGINPNKIILNKDKLHFFHEKCGKDFYMVPTKFKSGRRCPNCTKSNTENKIENFFKARHVNFEKQFMPFSKYGKYYKYDFYLPDLNLLLEYDGDQHYLPIYGEDQLKIQMDRDAEKTLLAKKHKYKLIRIPFWEFNNLYFHLENIIVSKKPKFKYNTYNEFAEANEKQPIQFSYEPKTEITESVQTYNSNKERFTTQTFQEKLDKYFPSEYVLLSEYVNNKVKVTVKHNICGEIFDERPGEFNNHIRKGKNLCPYCNQVRGTFGGTKEFFIKKVERLAPGEYELLSDYKDSKSNVTIRHIPCGTVREITVNGLMKRLKLNKCVCQFCGSYKSPKSIKKSKKLTKTSINNVVSDDLSNIDPEILKNSKIT